MNQNDNIQRVQDFYRLLLSDFPAAREKYFAENIIWENPLPAIVPFGGTYHGADELLGYFGGLDAAIDMQPLHITDFVANDNVVAAIGVEQDTRVKSTGKHYNMPFVHVIRFNDDGKVTHVREYNDTREMVAAFEG